MAPVRRQRVVRLLERLPVVGREEDHRGIEPAGLFEQVEEPSELLIEGQNRADVLLSGEQVVVNVDVVDVEKGGLIAE